MGYDWIVEQFNPCDIFDILLQLLLQIGGQCMPRYNNCLCIDVFLQQISAKIVHSMQHTVIYNQPEYQLNVSQLTDFLIITLITKNIQHQFIHEIIYEIKLLNDNLVGWMNKKFGGVQEICRVLQEKLMYEIVKQTGIIRFNLPDEHFPVPYVLKLNKKEERVTKVESKNRQQGFESMEIETKNNQLGKTEQKDIRNKQIQPNSYLKSNIRKKYHGHEVLPSFEQIQSEYDSKNNPFQQKENPQPQRRLSNREIKNLHDKQYTPKYPIIKRKSVNQNQKNNQIIENKNIKNIINTQIPFHIEQRARNQQQKRTLRSHKRHLISPHQQQQQIRIANKRQRDQNQIKKLRRENKQLKEEMKLMRAEMQEIKTSMLNQQNQMYRIEYLEKMLEDMHNNNIKKIYPNELNMYQPYQQYHQINNFQPSYQQMQIDRINKNKCRNQWRINQNVKNNEDFIVQGLKVTYNREIQARNNWSYVYLQNVINPNKIFALNIMVHKCLDQNIAFGIAFEKHSSKSSSWNQRDCYQYVGFSKMIFEGGKKKFQSGAGIWEGTNFTMVVNIKQGMIQWRSQRGSQACLQSIKLKNAKDKYVPFVRMKDRGDCIEFMGRP